jgi:hypothetical protein
MVYLKSGLSTIFYFSTRLKKVLINKINHQLCILKVVWPLASRKSVICLRNLYNEHIPMMSGCLLILALQFTSDKVESVLHDLDVNKGSGPDGIPPIILNNCVHLLSQNHYLFFFYRSMATSVFPDRWKVSRTFFKILKIYFCSSSASFN